MALPNLKTKLKQSLKKEIEQESAGGGNRDLRFVNYYDLKFEERMTVLFVPDVNGEFWSKFSKHGPNLRYKSADGKDRNVRIDHTNCARVSSGDDCSICQKGFDLFAKSKDTGDKYYHAEGKKWMPRDYTLVSLVVIESPMEIVSDETDNQVKLMYLPYGIEKVIRENISEELISEDELCTTPFVIKKTKNHGGKADYSSSYFLRNQVTDDDISFLEDLNVDQYDYLTLDVIPKNTTSDEMDDWLGKAEEAYLKATNTVSKGKSSGDDEDEEESSNQSPKPKSSSRLDRLRQAAKTSSVDEEDEQEEETEAPEEQEADVSPQEEAAKAKPTSNARDRLSSLRRK